MPLITISGPSGAGKSTLLRSISKQLHGKILPSWTTRQPRPGSPGEDVYTFVSEPEYLTKLNSLEFILSDIVAGNYYGTTRTDFFSAINSESITITDLTARSVADILTNITPDIIPIVVEVSKDVSLKRMRHRGDNEAKIQERLVRYDEEASNCYLIAQNSARAVIVNGEFSEEIVFSSVMESLCRLTGNGN